MAIVTLAPLASGDPTKGHFYAFHQSFIAEATLSGLDALIISEMNSQGHGFVPLLSQTYRPGRANFSRTSGDARRIIRHLESINFGQREAVFHVFEGGPRELLLLAKLLKELPGSLGHFNFHWAHNFAKLLARKSLTRAALRSLVQQLDNRVSFSSESTRLSHLATGVLGVPFSKYPIYSTLNTVEIISWKIRSLDYLFAPTSKMELDESWKMMVRLRRHSPDLKLGLFTKKELLAASGFREKIEQLDVRITDSFLDENGYRELIGNSRVLVLPYLSPLYVWGSSGRLADAALLGAKVLVPVNTALEDWVKELGCGGTIPRLDSEFFNQEMARMLEKPPEIGPSNDVLKPRAALDLVLKANYLKAVRPAGSAICCKLAQIFLTFRLPFIEGPFSFEYWGLRGKSIFREVRQFLVDRPSL
jgi:hypothetical protein